MENNESEEPQRKRSQPDSASTDNSKPVSFACRELFSIYAYIYMNLGVRW